MKIRINNIGAETTWRLSETSEITEGSDRTIAIVKYHPNGYYGMLEQYLKGGWEDAGDTISSNHCNIDKKCFLNEETHYVVAFLKYATAENSTQLTSVADRLLYIGEDEKKDFFAVYEIADRMLQERTDQNEKATDR